MHPINIGIPQVENERRADNTKKGMRQAQKNGWYMGTAPKGYSNALMDGDKVIVKPEYAKHITWAF